MHDAVCLIPDCGRKYRIMCLMQVLQYSTVIGIFVVQFKFKFIILSVRDCITTSVPALILAQLRPYRVRVATRTSHEAHRVRVSGVAAVKVVAVT